MTIKRKRTAKSRSSAVRPQTEHMEQSQLFTWIDETTEMQGDIKKYLALRWTHAIPNGYYRSPAARMKAKREGVKSGILDVFVPCGELGSNSRRKKDGYFGFYIEMKRVGEKVRETQAEFMDYLSLVNYKHSLCFFWQDAARLIVDYLGLTEYAPIGIPDWITYKESKERGKGAK